MSRLRETSHEQIYGLVSRVDGDRKLVEPRVQELYFTSICKKLSGKSVHELAGKWIDTEGSETGSMCHEPVKDSVLIDLRKLREGIVASGRSDEFVIDVFECSIRCALLGNELDSFLPAARYLLTDVYNVLTTGSATSNRLCLKDCSFHQRCHAICELYLLHLCSMDDYSEFVHQRSIMKDERSIADAVLSSLVQGNWIRWAKIRRQANSLQLVLIDKTAYKMQRHAVSSIGACYLSVNLDWVKTICHDVWEQHSEACGWQVSDSTITIKQPKTHKLRVL